MMCTQDIASAGPIFGRAPSILCRLLIVNRFYFSGAASHKVHAPVSRAPGPRHIAVLATKSRRVRQKGDAAASEA